MATVRLTESFTMDGLDAFVHTSQSLAYAPYVFTINGTPTTTRQIGVDPNDGVSWYWAAQSPIIYIQSVIPPVAGTVIVVTYEPLSSNLSGASVPDSISDLANVNTPLAPGPYPDPNPPDPTWDYTPAGGSGIYTTIYDNPGISNADQAAAAVAGIQRRASVTPRALTFKTDIPGWRIGQTLHVNHVGLDLINLDFIVVSISGKPFEVPRGRGSFCEFTIEAVILEDAPEQVPPDVSAPAKVITSIYPITTTAPFERLNAQSRAQPPAYIYTDFEVVLGSGGELLAGTPLGNRKFVLDDQTFVEVYILPNPAKPPIDQDLVVDVFLDDVSIFGDVKLIVTAGTTTPSSTLFRGYPSIFRALRGQIMTFSATYINIGVSPVNAEDVGVQIRGRIG